MSEKYTLEQRVERLESIEAIKKLKSDYGALVDAKDLDGIVALFTEDAVWEGEPFGRFQGRAEIRVCMDEPEMPWTKHYLVNPSIEVSVDGTTASGRWYLWQTGTFTDIGGENATAGVMMGVYDENYVNKDGRWYFSHMKVDIQHISDLKKGWVEEPLRGVVIPADR